MGGGGIALPFMTSALDGGEGPGHSLAALPTGRSPQWVGPIAILNAAE
jgi:hypothetical protein